jgi:hypothetical protein
MPTHRPLALLALLCALLPLNARAQTPMMDDVEDGILPATARWSADELPLSVYLVGQTPPEISVAQAIDATQQAIDAWSSVACIPAPLVWRGHIERLDQLPAGAIPIQFVAPSPDGCFWEPWTNLAITVTDCTPGAPSSVLVNTRDWRWALTPDYLQQLSAAPPQPTVSLPATLTHELGHVLGLGHAAQTPLATMAPRYLNDGGMLTLSALDRAAICALYAPEAARSACDTDAACARSLKDPGATCAEPIAGIRACEEDRGQTGDYCAQNLLVCDGICYLSSPTTGTGVCTQDCVADAECPQDWSCQEAGAEGRTVCLPTPMAPEDGGCASAPARAPGAWWGWCVVLGALLRRRARARR